MFSQRKKFRVAVIKRTWDGGKCAKNEMVLSFLHERALARAALKIFVPSVFLARTLSPLPHPGLSPSDVVDDNLQLFITLYHINV